MNIDYAYYEPNKHLKAGLKIWVEMVRELMAARELIWRLFVRNLSAKYKQAVLGFLWAVIIPLIAIASFMYLNRAGILEIEATEIPYPLYSLIGLTVFQLFSTGINSGCHSLVSAGDMISKINFPREVLVFASVAESIFEFIVKLIFIIVLFLFYQYLPPWQIIFFPILILPMVIFTCGLSLIFSLMNGIFRDTGKIVNTLAMLLMFLTPVFYPIKAKGLLFFKLNPLTALVNAPRDLIIYGYIKEPFDYMIAVGVSTFIFLFFWRVFHLVETKIPERI